MEMLAFPREEVHGWHGPCLTTSTNPVPEESNPWPQQARIHTHKLNNEYIFLKGMPCHCWLREGGHVCSLRCHSNKTTGKKTDLLPLTVLGDRPVIGFCAFGQNIMVVETAVWQRNSPLCDR